MTSLITVITTASYGNGTYISTAPETGGQSEAGASASWYAFGPTGTWITYRIFNTVTGVYTGTLTTNGYSGTYIQLTLPSLINLSSFELTTVITKTAPVKFKLFGSIDGSSWVEVYSQENESWATLSKMYIVTSQESFSIYRLVVNKTDADGIQDEDPVGRLIIARLKFFEKENNVLVAGSGNVGIGTTNPLQKLHVIGNIQASTQFLGQAADSVGAPSYSWTGDTNTGMYHPGADMLGLVTAGVERVSVLANGYVGIGTNNPSYQLSVKDNVQVFNVANDVMGLFSGTYGNYLHVGAWNQSGSTSKNIVMNWLGGNVGIGLASPSQKLHVNGIGRFDAQIQAFGTLLPTTAVSSSVVSSDSKLLFYDFGGQNWCGTGVDYSGRWWLRTGGSSTNMIVADNVGNVGIGTTNPIQKLHVAGTAIAQRYYSFTYEVPNIASGSFLDIGWTTIAGVVVAIPSSGIITARANDYGGFTSAAIFIGWNPTFSVVNQLANQGIAFSVGASSSLRITNNTGNARSFNLDITGLSR
jgi:hypothetical protein